MRREGFEMCVGRPRVLFQTDPETGQRLEPIEEVVIDVDEEYLRHRRREADRAPGRAARTCARPAPARRGIVFHAPSRALIGYHGEFLTDTRGTGVLNRVFAAYEPYKGADRSSGTPACWSPSEQGETAAYALWNLEDRGPMFIGAGREGLHRA